MFKLLPENHINSSFKPMKLGIVPEKYIMDLRSLYLFTLIHCFVSYWAVVHSFFPPPPPKKKEKKRKKEKAIQTDIFQQTGLHMYCCTQQVIINISGKLSTDYVKKNFLIIK